MESNKQTRQTIIRLLSSMASAKEISQYVKRFSQLDAKRFAVVKVGGAVLRDDLESLTSSLTFLQEVGLTPIVVHGAGRGLVLLGIVLSAFNLRTAVTSLTPLLDMLGDTFGFGATLTGRRSSVPAPRPCATPW